MVEWIVNTPMLYDKKLTDYRDKHKRSRTWTDQASHLGVTADELTSWYWTMRTVFGKLCAQAAKPKSGDGATELTQRQRWVVRSFNFLVPHIVRQPVRALGIGAYKAPLTSASGSEVAEDDGQVPGPSSQATPTPTPTPSSRAISHTPDGRTRKRPRVSILDDETTLMDEVAEQQEATTVIRTDVGKILSRAVKPELPRSAFAMWMGSAMTHFHDDIWPTFQKEAFELIHRCVAETRKLRKKEAEIKAAQPPQPPQPPAQ